MSTATQPLAVPREGFAALARDYSELVKARVTTLIVMTAWCGVYFAAAKSGCLLAVVDNVERAASASAWSAVGQRQSTK